MDYVLDGYWGMFCSACPVMLAKDYLAKLQAPMKGFYTFKQSTHSPLFEEPKSFIEIMINDVLNGNVNHADK